MAIRNWRWFHWLALSVVVGGVLGVVLTSFDWSDPSVPTEQWNAVRRKINVRTDAGGSVLTGFRVGPPTRDGDGKPVQQTTFWERQKNRTTGTWDLTRQFRVITSLPLSPASPRPDYGVLDYLRQEQKSIPSLDYRFEWWQVPRNLWALSMGGSVLLLGVAWPVANKVLVKLGLGAPPDERGEDLSRVRSTSEATALSTGPVVTAGDQQKLADLNAALASNVAGLAMTAAPGPASDGPATARPASPAVRPLAATETPAVAATAVQDDPNDFKGEFYPVARPKKDA